jgi:site-specific DNA recombinase
MRAFARARGYKVGEVLRELDVGGGKMRRPELDRALARIKDGTSGGLMVAKLDRFARNLEGALVTLREITEAGARLGRRRLRHLNRHR